MAGDHYRKPLHGERRPLSTLAMHGMIDAARQAQSLSATGGLGADLMGGVRRIMVGDIEEGEFELGDVVGFSEIPVQPSDGEEQFRSQLLWRAELYDAAKHGLTHFAVLVGGGLVPDGRYVEAITSGHVRTKIEVTDEYARFVIPKDGEKFFTTSSYGYPLLGKEPELGMRWAEVKLNNLTTGRIYGRNATGSDFLRGEIAAINTQDGATTWADVLTRPTIVTLTDFEGFGENVFHHISWCVIVAEVIPSDEVGEIAIAGIAPVRLNIHDPTHQFGAVSDHSRTMETRAYGGHARVLWRDTASGTGLILFPNTQLPTFGVATSDASSGLVDVEVAGLGFEAATIDDGS